MVKNISACFLVFCFSQVFVLHVQALSMKLSNDDSDVEFWHKEGRSTLFNLVNTPKIHRKAKNVILFIGDGMGISTLTASRILKGQLQGKSGEEGFLHFEKYPHTSLVKTYNLNKMVPDSAGTGTSIHCGVKANYETLKVNGKVHSRITDCDFVEKNKITSIMDWASETGKSTGIVTTTRITHATPASSYASLANRNWEGDSEIPEQFRNSKCKDAARQLVENKPGKNFNVILGGGRKYFFPKSFVDPQLQRDGKRKDGVNLPEKWLEMKRAKNSKAKYVSNRKELLDVNTDETDDLMGLFNYNHLQYAAENSTVEPSIEEMTEKAIKILRKNENGFVLMVEGGKIDIAHHDNFAHIALLETLEFEKAIEKAETLVNLDETLIIVTSDHSQSLNINGYAARETNILERIHSHDGSPMTILSYGTGPGNDHVNDTNDIFFRAQSTFKMLISAHSGEDVAVYAKGPMGYMFTGLIDQPIIAHIAAYAGCMWIYNDQPHCHQASQGALNSAPNLSGAGQWMFLSYFFTLFLYYSL